MISPKVLRAMLGTVLLAVLGMSIPRPAPAQTDNINAGMMSPRYTDPKLRGSRDQGLTTGQYDRINAGMMSPNYLDPRLRGPRNQWPAPVPGFTHGVRMLPGGWGGGTTVIIVNGSPCYVPSYYDAGFYGPGFGFGVQTGSFGFGYQNRAFAPNPPPAVFAPAFPPQSYPQAYAEGVPLRSDGTIRRDPGSDRSASADDDYYLNRKPKPTQRDPELAQAVADIEQAFRTGNVSLLGRHVDAQGTLVLQSKGHSRKDLAASVYLQMTRDALAEMKTVRFTLDHVEPASNGAWLAYGTHVLQADGGAEKRYSVGFVLKNRDGRYYVTEVSADPIQ